MSREEFREGFEAWHCEQYKTKHCTGAPTRDMHSGVRAEDYGQKKQQAMWECWQETGGDVGAVEALKDEIERVEEGKQPVAWFRSDALGCAMWKPGATQAMKDGDPLFTRADAAEIEHLNTVVEQQKNMLASLRAELTESYSITSIPDGYCVMPRRLTAENGAKAILLGEFKVHVTQECRECAELDEPDEHCEICDGEGEYCQHHTISWDQIKFIYSKAVEGLAVSAEPTTTTYRLLAAGDTIAATDEYLNDDATTWAKVEPGIFSGMKYIVGVMVPVRRDITSAEPTNKEGQ